MKLCESCAVHVSEVRPPRYSIRFPPSAVSENTARSGLSHLPVGWGPGKEQAKGTCSSCHPRKRIPLCHQQSLAPQRDCSPSHTRDLLTSLYSPGSWAAEVPPLGASQGQLCSQSRGGPPAVTMLPSGAVFMSLSLSLHYYLCFPPQGGEAH